jgi:hypothetical protein
MNDKQLEYIRNEVNKLKQLLDNPEPGLYTWMVMVGDQLKKVGDFYHTPPKE